MLFKKKTVLYNCSVIVTHREKKEAKMQSELYLRSNNNCLLCAR